MCGLWQCGETGFQMTLQRSFSTDPSIMPMTTGARPMSAPISYKVTRVYTGSVDASSAKVVEGKMAFFDGDGDVSWALDASPIGFFVLAAVVQQ